METRVKSLRAGAYFRSSLIGSNGGCPLGYRGFIFWMCASHRFLFLTEVKSSIPRERCHPSLYQAWLLFYPEAFFSRPRPARRGWKTDTPSREVMESTKMYLFVSVRTNCFVSFCLLSVKSMHRECGLHYMRLVICYARLLRLIILVSKKITSSIL